MTDLPDDLILLNCAQCRRVMVRPVDVAIGKEHGIRKVFAGRVAGRPYCVECLDVPPPPTGGGKGTLDAEDDNPWQSNAIRQMEEGTS